MFIDEATCREDLEVAAIFECEFPLEVIEVASTEELREMVIGWVMAGDEIIV